MKIRSGFSPSPSLPIFALCFLTLLLSAVCTRQLLYAQSVSKLDIERGREMLKGVKSDIEKNYYDPTYRGIDLDARFKLADEKIKSAQSNGQILGVIAQLLIEFNDSHTFLLPPARTSTARISRSTA